MKIQRSELVAELCRRAHTDLDRVAQLYPLVREHARRGGVRLPAGAEGGGHPEGVHSDPTADAALEALARPPEPEALDRRAMLRALDALHRLDLARKALESRIPAQAGALRLGRDPRDGRSEADVAALADRRRALRGDIECVVCRLPAAQLRAGMDEPCYRAWNRAGRPDRSEWAASRRRWLDEQRAGASKALLSETTDWDPALNVTRGPADGVDRRAA